MNVCICFLYRHFNNVSEVCHALFETLKPIYIPLPDANEFRIIADNFKEKWNFPSCVGAVDGRHFSIETPPNSGTFFFNYKKFTSFVLMSECDAFLRFTWLNVGDYRSLNDASIFNESDLGEAWRIKTLIYHLMNVFLSSI